MHQYCVRVRKRMVAAFAAFAVALGLQCGWMAQQAGAAVTIVENGNPSATIVLPEEPTRDELLAAAELRHFVERVSGARLDVVIGEDAPQGHVPILLGRAAPEALSEAVGERSDDPSAFALAVGDNRVAVRGLPEPDPEPLGRGAEDPTTVDEAWELIAGRELGAHSSLPGAFGTRNGVYDLLEKIGVRWFIPGEIGTVIPEKATITLEDQRTVEAPSFPSRYLQGVRAPVWESRMRNGGMRFPSSHGIPGFGHGGDLFEEHPEYFAYIDGDRRNRQLCVSNEQVVERAIEHTKEFFRNNPHAEIIGMGAFDGRGFCECENCRALDGGDYDPYGGYTSMTDRYVWFFNQVLEGIEDEFPEKRIGFYAYSVYNRPPVKWEPDERIVPAVALITMCRMHGTGNPVCPEKSYQQWIVGEWGKLVPEVYDRGYWFNLADPGLPFFQVSRVATEVPLGHELGIAGWRVESPYNWGGEAPTRYVAMQLMWDHAQDVDALLSDFYSKFFGPAAEPMRTYIETLDHARRDADYHTGSSWDVPMIYTEEVRSQARDALNQAASAVSDDSAYATRIEIFRNHFDYLDAFVTMMESRMAHDYATANEALGQIDALREKQLNDYEYKMMGRKAESYMARFFRRATEQGYAKTHEEGELVAGLDPVWKFQIDPEAVGEDIGLYRADITGGNWQTMDARSTWSNEGLRYYKGIAWYRQNVDVPADAEGERVFLWIGGMDEAGKVWVNGQLIGEGGGTFRPFDLDATDVIEPGEENVVVIKAINEGLNELGTGGIMGPVMFYAPSDPDAEPSGEQFEGTGGDMETIGGD